MLISLVILNFLKSLFKKLMFCFRIVLDLQRLSACGDSVFPMVTILHYCVYQSQLPCGSDSKESTCNVGDLGSIPGSGRSAGEGNATHSSILAWKIPWMEELGGLQPMGSQRVGHNWATSLSLTLYLNFLGLYLLSLFCPRIPSGYHITFSRHVSLSCSRLWQFVKLFLFLWPWQFWGLLVRFLECPSFGYFHFFSPPWM